jgi:hypothetical protein
MALSDTAFFAPPRQLCSAASSAKNRASRSGVSFATLVGPRVAAGGTVAPQSAPWSTLEGIAFPHSQVATLFEATTLDDPLLAARNALYANGTSLPARATLRPQDVNALVAYFLKLGGHYIDPAHNGGNPSRKLARWQLLGGNDDKFASPANLPIYPLSPGLARLTAARALLDAAGYLGSPTPQFGQFFRARAYDHKGQKLWPPAANDADCVGGGFRAVGWFEDESLGSGRIRFQGYQNRFFGWGGSYTTMLSLFPSDPLRDVESYFWCTPGVEAMGIDPARFDRHMDAFATNTLMRTHFSDFETNHVSVVEHYYGQ